MARRREATAGGGRSLAASRPVSGQRLAVVSLLLLGFFLRVCALADLPPGWRDDEVIETTVHAQRALDGELPLFFREASGHEPLYHWLSAGAIALWGRGLFQVRLVSAYFGLLALAAHYRLALRLLGPRAALIATAALAFSFWALMYSRVKIRHISALPFILLAFDSSLRLISNSYRDGSFTLGRETLRRFAAQGDTSGRRQGELLNTDYGLPTPAPAASAAPRPHGPGPVGGAGADVTRYALRFTFYALRLAFPLALSLYTYPAARAAPVILIAFAVYLALFHRPAFALGWRAMALALALTVLLAVPLAVAIRAQPEAQVRLAEVGRPLAALLDGDPRPALVGAVATLGMFGWAGDPEALYNLPGRPVFEPLGAALFALGLIACAWRWRDSRYAFLLLWLFLGLAPAFASIPAASLGHAIVALPAVYLILAVGLEAVIRWIANRSQPTRSGAKLASSDRARPFAAPPRAGSSTARLRVTDICRRASPLVLCALCLAFLAFRDLRDYFARWPADPQVRHLYRAGIHEAAGWLREAPLADVALTGRLSLWDARALELDAPGLRARWFNPETAMLYPANPQAPLITFADPSPSEWVGRLLEAGFTASGAAADFGLWLPKPERALPFGEPRPQAWAIGLEFAGFEGPRSARPGETLQVNIAWRVAAGYAPPAPAIGASPDPPSQPFTTFVHMLGSDGAFVTGYDRFDANGFRLWPGDVVIQRYLPALPADLAPGEYTLAAGLYDPAAGERFQMSGGGDTFSFHVVQVDP